MLGDFYVIFYLGFPKNVVSLQVVDNNRNYGYTKKL